MRRVGIYYAYWTQEWDADFLPFVRRVKGLGFDQLEVNGGTIARLSEAARQRLREEAEGQGIALSYGIGLPPDHDVSSLDDSTRRRGLELMRRMIEAVGRMGGGMIGGTVHSCWPATLPEGVESKRRYWERSVASMRELCPIAEDNRVRLNVEVINRFEQFLLNTSREAVEFVGEVGSPACGILLDTFHLNIEEDSIGDAIRQAGSLLAELHVGETNRKPPGRGRMPWPEIRTALDEIAFDGPIVMEPFVRPGGTVGRNVGVWRDLAPGEELDAMAAESARFVRTALAGVDR